GHHVVDMRPIEIATLVPLGTLVVVFGLFPGLVLDLIGGPTQAVLQAVGAHGATAVNLFFWQ
ncbi:MAG: hypothetical protein ACXWMX_01160, partial [Candidatus Limnocylindrales bacterium]